MTKNEEISQALGIEICEMVHSSIVIGTAAIDMEPCTGLLVIDRDGDQVHARWLDYEHDLAATWTLVVWLLDNQFTLDLSLSKFAAGSTNFVGATLSKGEDVLLKNFYPSIFVAIIEAFLVAQGVTDA